MYKVLAQTLLFWACVHAKKWSLSYSVRTPNLICGNTFTPKNDKIHIRQPISMISTSQTWARVYIFAIFNKRWNNSRSVAAIVVMIGHVIPACKSDKVCEYCRKVTLSGRWTAEIETLCMILYMLIYKDIPWELVVEFWQRLIKNWSYNACTNLSRN